jgi:ParB family chromosome partitioning protein
MTAYDIALMETDANVADYWRPSKANYLGRITREQLLAIGEEILGKEWAVRCGGFKKGKLAEVLDAAFSSPAEHGETPEQIEKLKSWLPSGMAFEVTLEPRPVKAKKTKTAA